MCNARSAFDEFLKIANPRRRLKPTHASESLTIVLRGFQCQFLFRVVFQRVSEILPAPFANAVDGPVRGLGGKRMGPQASVLYSSAKDST
jgi:hypothetical protein